MLTYKYLVIISEIKKKNYIVCFDDPQFIKI